MHVQVSLKLELEATASVTQMEQEIQQAGQQAMREAFKQAIRQREEQRGGCPFCGQHEYRLEGTVRRVIATMFGRVQVPRRRFRCQSCYRRWCPANGIFAELKGATMSAPLQEAAILAGSCFPVSRGQHAAQTAVRSPDQCGRNPSADQPVWQAASRVAARGGRAELPDTCPAGASRATDVGADTGGNGWRVGL